MRAVFVMMVVMMTGLRAQVPQRFSYQVVVRDAEGALVSERQWDCASVSFGYINKI
ncbi:MAG: hypothetical protein KBT04_08235 [Bacteroidales bacterium]|nr:hypothetical protein [Candidatus Colimorpha onthohippi]